MIDAAVVVRTVDRPDLSRINHPQGNRTRFIPIQQLPGPALKLSGSKGSPKLDGTLDHRTKNALLSAFAHSSAIIFRNRTVLLSQSLSILF